MDINTQILTTSSKSFDSFTANEFVIEKLFSIYKIDSLWVKRYDSKGKKRAN